MSLKLWPPEDGQTVGLIIDPHFFFACFRKADRSAEDGGRLEQSVKDEDILDATTSSKAEDIEMLMSQMHDLSFMLESKLSVPQS